MLEYLRPSLAGIRSPQACPLDHLYRSIGLPDAGVPDLRTQYESLLHWVWAAEEDWRFDDRLALAAAIQGWERPAA